MGQSRSLAWDFACPDWEERLRDGRTLVPDLPLDKKAAEDAVGIFNLLCLPDVPGKPPLEKAAGEWQRDIVRAVFGSLDRDGRRRVPELFALVPKKNSKTTGGAAIMVTALMMNNRPRAEFILVGPTQEVADLAFQQASGMIDADPHGYLQKRFTVQEHIKTIFDRRTKAKLKVKTFDLKVMTGAKPAGVLVDELHLMSTMSFASRVIGQIRGGVVANPEAFLIFITTQSDQPPAGVFKAELQYARGVRDGRITNDARMLPVLYEFPEKFQRDVTKPWQDPECWPQVLPNLNRSITIERLISDYRSAKEKGIEEECRWASQHLNIEIGMAMHADRWAGAEFWAARTDKALTFDEVLARSETIVIGVDGGGLDDLFGLVVLGRCRVTKHWLAWSHAWCHEGVLARRRSIAETLRDFARAGEITIVDDKLEDIAAIVEIVRKINEAGKLALVSVDPAGIGELIDALATIGVTQAAKKVDGARQGFAMMNAIKTAERKLANGTLWHHDSGAFAWCVSNIKIEPLATAIRATKQNAGDAKIDIGMALFNAVTMMAENPASGYDIAAMVA